MFRYERKTKFVHNLKLQNPVHTLLNSNYLLSRPLQDLPGANMPTCSGKQVEHTVLYIL